MAGGTQMAEVAALVGDPARASMLAVLMDGRAHTAGELGAAADIAASTAKPAISASCWGSVWLR